jgi:hypothetical protein
VTDSGAAPAPPAWTHHETEVRMFFFFSNKLGWPGSILVSVLGTLLLVGLVKLFF